MAKSSLNKALFLASILRILARYKLRSFFMSAGIVVGVAALVLTRSIGASAEQQMIDKINRMFGASSLVIVAGGGGMGARRSGPVTSLVSADLEAIANAIDEVAAWDPWQSLGDQIVKHAGKNHQLRIFGHSEHAERVWNRSAVRGEFFSAEDVATAARVAVIGTKTAQILFGDESPIGQQIQVGTALFRVKGVLEPYGIDPHGMDRDDELQIPITTLMRRLMNVDHLMAAKVVVDDAEHVDEVAERIATLLRRRHAIADGEPEDFSIITPTGVQKGVAKAHRVMKVFVPAAAVVALLVAAVVIANLMLIGVRERMPEIGLRLAVGATVGGIRLQFLGEIMVLAILSGGLGIGLGGGAILVLTMTAHLPVSLAPDAVALGLVAALAVGLLAGYLPARRASRLDPVASLR